MKREHLILGAILAILLLPAGVALADDLTHFASEGVTYQTNSGLEVTLGDDRDVEAVPFPDDATWASSGVEIESMGESSLVASDHAFEGDTMALTLIDAGQNSITVSRDDLSSPVTIEGGTTGLILHDVEVGNGQTDLEVVASSETTLTIQNIEDTNGVQAVDADGNIVAGDTDTSDNTAELTLDAGEYELQLEDGPSVLEIRDITNNQLINETSGGENIEVTVEFFGDDGSVEQRTTDDGTVDMTGLPADERFSVSIDAGDDYVQRQVILPSLLEQGTAYLLPQDSAIETVEPRFLLEDPSNQFDPQNSEIVLQRPIDEDDGEGTKFVAVAGDRIGINGFDTILERDQRYRVIVTDPASGSQRQLGEFTPTQSEEVTLTVEDVAFDSVSDVDGIEWTARYVEVDDDLDEIEFIFRDDFNTQILEYRIFERGNEANVLVDGTATGNVTISETVPPGGEDTVWMVEWETTRGNGDTLSATRPVSTDRLPIGPSELPDRWTTIFAMLGLFAVAGLFGAANPGIGGIAVATTGGMFFMLGWLPDGTGGLMVVLALFIAVLSYTARRARGATA